MAHFPPQLNATVPASAPQANTIGSAQRLQPLAAVQDLPQHQARNLRRRPGSGGTSERFVRCLRQSLLIPTASFSISKLPKNTSFQSWHTLVGAAIRSWSAVFGSWCTIGLLDAGHGVRRRPRRCRSADGQARRHRYVGRRHRSAAPPVSASINPLSNASSGWAQMSRNKLIRRSRPSSSYSLWARAPIPIGRLRS